MTQAYRTERDGFGEVRVPAKALYGAHTQRAVDNFPISGLRMPRTFIRALGLIKGAAAAINRELGLLEPAIAKAIQEAAKAVEGGRHDDQFPVDMFQTGSATSTHMNANEVIATLAAKALGKPVHPNDHVNMSQSSNDVIPSAIHLSALLELTEQLLPSLKQLQKTITEKAKSVDRVVKTGRTHLMDAMPLRMSQELSGWASQIASNIQRIESSLPRLSELAIGGTAVGTGVNAHPEFAKRFVVRVAQQTRLPLVVSPNYFRSLSSQDTAVELSGQLKTLAVSLTKICNDLRLMNSGPHAGFGEISLPAMQAGSSIMPGKVNPVIPEAVLMVCAQVIGNDVTITLCGQAGNFQLNTMLPVLIYDLLQGITWLANASRLLADAAIKGFTVNEARIAETLERNPMLVTALNPVIGYEQGAKIAKQAVAQGRTVKDVAAELTKLTPQQLERALNPRTLTEGGISK